jgi:hypothetical protein
MKIFLFETTTDSESELCGGIQIICAETKPKALSLLALKGDEKVVSINEIKLVEGIIFKQEPIIS